MPAIAMGLAWAGYTLGLWGWCLLRGYNVTLGQLASPTHPAVWATVAASHVPDGQVLPVSSGAPGAAGNQSGAGLGAKPPAKPPKKAKS